MNLFVPREIAPGETRTAITPATAARFKKLGFSVTVEAGLGAAAGFPDSEYEAAGAILSTDRAASLAAAEIILRVRKPPAEEIRLLRQGTLHISHLDPFHEKHLIDQLAEQKVRAVAMELIPRSTRAQKMDALTSQANLAGYYAVLLGALHMNKVLPMMSTAAGTLLAAKVFIIGAGVAGLQAIATARRLGARVEAFDTRPVVAEQIRSLGAKYVEIDLGDTGQTEQGYAKELTPEQLARQREGIKAACASSDLVITTAQVFGRPAPRILTADMVAAMRPGSVIVDMAVETGGNVEGSQKDRVVELHGVKIVGETNLPARIPQHASQVYAMNVFSFVEEFWDKKEKRLVLRQDDEIIASALLTDDGIIRDHRFR